MITARMLAVGLAALGVSACRGGTSQDAPIVPIRNMYDQPRYDPNGESPFFKDQRTMREPPAGTVPREAPVSPEVNQGLSDLDQQTYVMEIPGEVSEAAGGMMALVERGQNRYNIYCVPCHAPSGGGGGMVVKRGMLAPPSLHEERLRKAPDGQIFAVISNGIRNMPAYGRQLNAADRWAIVSYVRALQLSQVGATTAVAQKR